MNELSESVTEADDQLLPQLTPLLRDVRMRLHIDRIPERLRRESIVTVTDRDILGGLISAYRQTPWRVETTLANPWSRPMTIAQVAAQLHRFSPANQEAFRTYQRKFASTAERISTTIPVYRLDGGRFFLLDGNHRAAAIYLSDVPFKITMISLDAPPDRRFLVALKYWDGGMMRFWRRPNYT